MNDVTFLLHVGPLTVCTADFSIVKLNYDDVCDSLRLGLLTAVNHLFQGVDLLNPAGSQSAPLLAFSWVTVKWPEGSWIRV